MPNKVLVSLIIPYYNARVSLSKLLSSIPEYNWLEVIVVNDHSDNIEDIIAEHKRSTTFMQEKGRRWAGAARNLGLKKSTGQFILFADADDYFLEGAFEKVYSYCHKSNDLVFFTPTSKTESGDSSLRHLSYKQLILDFLKADKNTIKYRFHVPWSKLISRELIIDNNISFDEVIASNDVNFSLKCSLYAKKIAATTDEIYCVIESNKSLTKQLSEEVIDSRFEALSRYNDFLLSKGDNNLAAMSGHLFSAYKFGFYKFLSRYFYCRYKGYKIFYSWSHIISIIKRRKLV
ncbi:glycosyltransferase family 2 protein [Pseudoalteromonas sp. Angola-7]|uniref:glycosyltransferase family 2 protein n=1 Tax=Pseudoalteromonas sp. Angola-7 TaxID=3025336 RepID=UPI0023598756|nr:glycosyltransferase family 2 protein [Pseudoalteromonas sp. Angola-7]MDC9529672.1 glycosyltransferase family 2 protein [Pseudoalteromonas sp. Angola-7]